LTNFGGQQLFKVHSSLTAAVLPPLNLLKPPNNIILVRDVDDELVQHVFALFTVAVRALLTLSWPSGHVVFTIHVNQFVAPVPIIINFVRVLHRFQHIYAQLAVLKETSNVNRQISSRAKIQQNSGLLRDSSQSLLCF
jgi:hypothetical protein